MLSIHALSHEILILISLGIGLVSFRFVRFSSLRFVSILVLVSSRIIHLVSLVRSITRSLVRSCSIRIRFDQLTRYPIVDPVN